MFNAYRAHMSVSCPIITKLTNSYKPMYFEYFVYKLIRVTMFYFFNSTNCKAIQDTEPRINYKKTDKIIKGIKNSRRKVPFLVCLFFS